MDTLKQINTENALDWDVKSYYDNQAWQTEQNQINRDWQSSENEKKRDWESAEAELDRKHADQDREDKQRHDKEILEAKTAAEKETLRMKHAQEDKAREDEQAHEMAKLAVQYGYKNSSSGGSGGSSGSGKVTKTSGGSSSSKSAVASTLQSGKIPSKSFTNYDDAASYMKSKGVPNSYIAGTMTMSEWSRRRSSYTSTGIGGTEAKNYSSYPAYISDRVEYGIKTYCK
jgi:hypothetical protein